MFARKAVARICSGMLLALLISTSLMAQFRAGIQGTIVDANGGLIPEATVTLTSQETTVERTDKTNGSGVFTISGLAPGKYTLSVEKAGFAKKTLTDVQVAAEQMQSVTVPLEIGQVSETVSVSGEAAQATDTETLPSAAPSPQRRLNPYHLFLAIPTSSCGSRQVFSVTALKVPALPDRSYPVRTRVGLVLPTAFFR